MLQFLINNVGTIVVSLLLAVIVFLIVVRLINNKRQGKTSCSCGCSGCAMSDVCHAKEKKQSEDSQSNDNIE